MSNKDNKVVNQDMDEYEKLKQEYIQKKGIQKDKIDDDEYNELRQKYIERKGMVTSRTS